MILKLTVPASKRPQHVFIPATGLEVRSVIVTDLSEKDLERHATHLRDQGNDVRFHVLWPIERLDSKGIGLTLKVQPAILELKINSSPRPLVILTNYDALLLTDEGKRIDRLFRYNIPTPAGVTPGAGEMVTG